MTATKTDHAGARRVGLFGGTFDPVHTGHLVIAESVRELARLDIVIFIPSAVPPHKHYDLMFPAVERYEMLRAAVASNPCFTVSDIELRRSGPSFTIDTIREMKTHYPGDTELFFIVGRDNLYEIEQWKDPQAIVEECTILAADRDCHSGHAIPSWLEERITTVASPLVNISSTDIRQRIAEQRSIRYLVPDSVCDMIPSSR